MVGARVLPLMAFTSAGDRVDRLKRLIALDLYDPDAEEIAEAMLRCPETCGALALDPRWQLPAPRRPPAKRAASRRRAQPGRTDLLRR